MTTKTNNGNAPVQNSVMTNSAGNNKQPARVAMGPGGGARGPGEKPKDLKQALGKLIRYCKPYLPIMIIAVFLAALSSVASIMLPGKIKEMTSIISDSFIRNDDKVIIGFTSVDLEGIAKIGLLLIAVYIASLLCSLVQSLMMASTTQKISRGLRRDISKKINLLPLRYFDNIHYGNVLSRVTNDVDTISRTLSESVMGLVSGTTLLVGVVIMMFVYSPIMAITAILSSLLGFIIMMVIIKTSQKFFVGQQSALGQLNGHIEEVYSGHSVVKTSNAGKAVTEKFSEINTELYNSAWKSNFMSGLMQPLMSLAGNISFVAVCVVGGLVIKDLSIIVAFILYARIFSQPLTQIAQGMSNIQSAAAASERVFNLLDEPELPREIGKQRLEGISGDVTFEHVSFGYLPDKTVINDFSAHAKAGQKIAIVGPTGAGKTTLVNLLMRFYEVNGGKILIDGVSISDITRENVHELFGMVLQDTWLFEGTIRENIAYSKKNVTDEEIYAAARAAGIDHHIRTLTDGYNTILNDQASLSSGQRQLVTIARAMVENAPMLILDEATSNVDTRTEILIQQAMDALTKGRTSFVIAHRLSTIRNADLILVMRNGDIVESGTHNELISKDTFYKELYNSQFEEVV